MCAKRGRVHQSLQGPQRCLVLDRELCKDRDRVAVSKRAPMNAGVWAEWRLTDDPCSDAPVDLPSLHPPDLEQLKELAELFPRPHRLEGVPEEGRVQVLEKVVVPAEDEDLGRQLLVVGLVDRVRRSDEVGGR